ncbi:MAG: cobalamin B12-binding domain-containing protein [Candidatus Omnitrophica bacterium]|nr:cobalamin B12-binding domain-containing protein [Candidatus Omnitrophota bacterium]
MKKKKKIVLAKPGLDGHDRGIQIVASALKEGGMDVIYLGLRQTPEMIVNAAIQKKANVIAVSVLTGSHMTVFRKMMKLLKEKGIKEMLVTGGGIIPEADQKKLSKLGVGRLFGPGTPLEEIVSYIKNWKGSVS